MERTHTPSGHPTVSTLSEWLAKQPLNATRHESGMVSIPDVMLNHRKDAFHLSDAVVSGISGGSMWIRPD